MLLLLLLVKVEEHIGGSQSGVAAEIDLAAGSKPAQGVFFSGSDRKCSFRKIVFSGNAEHQLVREPLLQNADGCGIAMENLVSKGINNILFHFQ